jgi:hypothetical protein
VRRVIVVIAVLALLVAMFFAVQVAIMLLDGH